MRAGISALHLLASPVGSVSGTVKDSTGAVVPGVKLVLTSIGTNASITTTSNAQGEFQFIQLPPADYSLVAEATGFKKVTISSLVVQVDQITHLELTVEVGNLSESVQVEAEAPLLESDKSTLSSVVDSRNIANMPLNGRQALDLALITPGVLPTATGTQVFSFNVAGARSQSNVYSVGRCQQHGHPGQLQPEQLPHRRRCSGVLLGRPSPAAFRQLLRASTIGNRYSKRIPCPTALGSSRAIPLNNSAGLQRFYPAETRKRARLDSQPEMTLAHEWDSFVGHNQR